MREEIRDLNPGDPVDRADAWIVRALRYGLSGFLVLVGVAGGAALVEAGWTTAATLAGLFGIGVIVVLLVVAVILLTG